MSTKLPLHLVQIFPNRPASFIPSQDPDHSFSHFHNSELIPSLNDISPNSEHNQTTQEGLPMDIEKLAIQNPKVFVVASI
jgi:hypothetical protein